MYTWCRITKIDVDIAMYPLPSGIAHAGVTVYALLTFTVQARAGGAEIPVDIAGFSLPSGIAHAGVAVYSIYAGTIDT
jgi:hypothetical protein